MPADPSQLSRHPGKVFPAALLLWHAAPGPAPRQVPETATFGPGVAIPLDQMAPEQRKARDFVVNERGQVSVLHSVLAIRALPTAIPCARLHARNVMSGWNLLDQADTVELIVSELVTNAVQAAVDCDGRPPYSDEGGLACVHLRLSSDRVFTLIEVRDDNRDLPTPTQANRDDESGRGLMLVTALSQRWGWELSRHGNGKTVWALVEGLPAGVGLRNVTVQLACPSVRQACPPKQLRHESGNRQLRYVERSGDHFARQMA